MQRVKVKICGLQEEVHVRAAAEAGADYVGLVFAPSRRRVTPRQAARLTSSLRDMPSRPVVVGVFVNETCQQVNAIVEQCGLDMVQLSGDEGADYCARVARPIIKTIRVFPGTTKSSLKRRIQEILQGQPLESVSFLLDTGGEEVYGGTGRTFDWCVAREVAVSHPVIVAGGLDPTSVGELLEEMHPYGVDVSSGVERDGRKDSTLIRAFVRAVRKVEQEKGHGISRNVS